MYDYIKDLSGGLTEEHLAEVFGMIALLNEQPVCKDWVPLIAAVGVEGMLNLSKTFDGRSFTLPPFYQTIVVYAALLTVSAMQDCSKEEAKKKVIGGLILSGFDELVDKVAELTSRFTGDAKPSSP